MDIASTVILIFVGLGLFFKALEFLDSLSDPDPAEIKASQRYYTLKSGRPPLDCWDGRNAYKLNPTKDEINGWLAERTTMLRRPDDSPDVRENKDLWWRLLDEIHAGTSVPNQWRPPNWPPTPAQIHKRGG